MGLDITAYRKLAPAPHATLDEDGCPEEYDSFYKPGASMEWSEKHFPGRGKGIEPQTVYSFDEKYGFRAGSYSGYNAWRDSLAQMVGHTDKTRNGPFHELIEFADNEGVIGPVVSKKLDADFKKYRDMAWQFAAHAIEDKDERQWFLDKYENWAKAFAMAADGGAVDFH